LRRIYQNRNRACVALPNASNHPYLSPFKALNVILKFINPLFQLLHGLSVSMRIEMSGCVIHVLAYLCLRGDKASELKASDSYG